MLYACAATLGEDMQFGTATIAFHCQAQLDVGLRDVRQRFVGPLDKADTARKILVKPCI